jgi:hypothetical protein
MRRSDWHKRLMLSATILLLGAAVVRIVAFNGVHDPRYFILAEYCSAFVFFVPCFAYDWMTRRKLHPANIVGLALILLDLSTGAIGIQTRRGQVYTGGVSLLHDLTSRLTIGAELYGGVSEGAGHDKTQLQAMLGGQFSIRDGLALSFGILGGKYGATPSLGGQIGVAVDIPKNH